LAGKKRRDKGTFETGCCIITYHSTAGEKDGVLNLFLGPDDDAQGQNISAEVRADPYRMGMSTKFSDHVNSEFTRRCNFVSTKRYEKTKKVFDGTQCLSQFEKSVSALFEDCAMQSDEDFESLRQVCPLLCKCCRIVNIVGIQVFVCLSHYVFYMLLLCCTFIGVPCFA
jgi:hypothetical protein